MLLPFTQLKPICVELLGQVPNIKSPASYEKTRALLQGLHGNLEKYSEDAPSPESSGRNISASSTPLSQALISYVFFPVAQLLRASTESEASKLPPRIRELVFAVLTALCRDWWQSWTELIEDGRVSQAASASGKSRVHEQRKVWEQLLILAASSFSPSNPSKSSISQSPPLSLSEDLAHAVLLLIEALLSPRTMAVETLKQPPAQSLEEDEWEWDGVSELPSLDDYDTFMQNLENQRKDVGSASATQQTRSRLQQLYPSSRHFESLHENNTSKGVLAHILMSSLDVARKEAFTTQTRALALRIVRMILVAWIAGECVDTDDQYDICHLLPSLDGVTADCNAQDSSPNNSAKSGDRIAMFLPGVVSGLVGILAPSGDKVLSPHAQTYSEALKTLKAAIILSLADIKIDAKGGLRTAESRSKAEAEPVTASLEDLFASAKLTERDLTNKSDEGLPVLRQNQNNVDGNTPAQKPSNTSDNDAEWLDNTIAHIAVTLQSIDHLCLHDNGLVRLQVVSLAARLLQSCPTMLHLQTTAARREAKFASWGGGSQGDVTQLLLRWLVDVASDTSGSLKASECATNELVSLLRSSKDSVYLQDQVNALNDEMQNDLRGLPRLLSTFGQDGKLHAAARRSTFFLRLASGAIDGECTAAWAIAPLLTASSSSERWIATLLGSFQIDESTSYSQETGTVVFVGVGKDASIALLDMFKELGRASARSFERDVSSKEVAYVSSLSILRTLVSIGSRWRSASNGRLGQSTASQATSSAALLVADQMMQGIAEVLDDALLAVRTGKEAARLARRSQRFAKDILTEILGIWDADEDELMQEGDRTADADSKRGGKDYRQQQLYQPEEDDSVVQEHRRGYEASMNVGQQQFQLGPAVNLDFVSSATVSKTSRSQRKLSLYQRRKHIVMQMQRGDALLLSIAASAAKILGPSLRKMLLQLLYPIVCGIASSSSAVSRAAGQTLSIMAHSAGYASVQGCVLDHADYVLGAASHRLVSSLAHELYAVSVQSSDGGGGTIMPIRMSGESAQTYTPLMSAQSAPLVLVEVIRMLGNEAVALVEDAVDEVLDAIDKFHLEPVTCEGLLSVLDRLVEVMQSDVRRSNDTPRRGPSGRNRILGADFEKDLYDFEEWLKSRREQDTPTASSVFDAADAADATEVTTDADPAQDATRSQQVTVAMLQKALPFLSHSSRTIRMRCLRLLSHGIDLLCLQGRTVEPLSIVHSLWPLLMARLGFNPSRILPKSHQKLPSVAELDESDFFVCIEAVRLVATLAHHLVEFVSTEKMLRQAMPRLLLLLRILERDDDRFNTSTTNNGPTSFTLSETGPGHAPLISAANMTKSSHPRDTIALPFSKRRMYRPFSPLAILIEHLIKTLDVLVDAMGASMSEADLFAFATHPTLLGSLDKRQIESVRLPAQHLFFETLAKRNESLVWLVLSAAISNVAMEEAAGGTGQRSRQGAGDPGVTHFPAFLRCDDLRIDWAPQK